MNVKDNLVESTLLALQGKLNLTESKVKKQEDVEVETDEVEVTVGENKTIIDTDDSTVTIEKSTEECADCDEDTNVDELVDTETFDETPLSTEEPIADTEDVETIEVPVEGEETIVPEEDVVIDTEDTEDTEESEEDDEDEVLENKEIKTEDVDPRPNETKMYDLIESGTLDTTKLCKELLGFIDDKDIQRFMEIYEYNNLTESKECTENCEKQEEECSKEEKEECDEPISKFSSKTFNEAITKMYKSKYKTIESFKTTGVSLKNESIKITGKLTNVDGITKDICLEMKKLKENKSFTKYELTNYKGLLKESNNSTLKMMTMKNKDNILECKYIITK